MADVPFYGLDQQKFEELIADSGKLVTWQAGYRCSCWVEASGSPNYDCKACGGMGYVYQTSATVTALMSGIDTKKDFLPAGEWKLGDITCTVPNRLRTLVPFTAPLMGTEVRWIPNPMWEIGEADLVTLPDSEQRTSEILKRGAALWMRPADTLLHSPESLIAVKMLFVTNPVTGLLTVYTPGIKGTDFVIAGGIAQPNDSLFNHPVTTVVTWATGSRADYTVNGNIVSFNPNGTNAKNLAGGQQYSITYTHLSTYIVYQNLPQARDQYGQKFPRKVVLRLRGVNLK